MDILDDMGVSKLSAKVFSKVNYSFNWLKWNLLCSSLSLCIQKCGFHPVSSNLFDYPSLTSLQGILVSRIATLDVFIDTHTIQTHYVQYFFTHSDAFGSNNILKKSEK